MPETIRTVGVAVTLALSVEELRTLLADNTDLVAGLFTTLVGTAASANPVEPTGSVDALAGLAANGLTPVEKILALQRVPAFARVSADEALELARVTRTVEFAAGAQVFPASATPAIWIVLSGELALEDGARAVAAARGGDIIGSMSTMAGIPLGRAATARQAGLALRIDREELFELLAERPMLLRQLFESLITNH